MAQFSRLGQVRQTGNEATSIVNNEKYCEGKMQNIMSDSVSNYDMAINNLYNMINSIYKIISEMEVTFNPILKSNSEPNNAVDDECKQPEHESRFDKDMSTLSWQLADIANKLDKIICRNRLA